jgi:type I restriction enzyme M protein
MTERRTDDFIFGLLRDAGIKYIPDGSDIKEIVGALATASKAKTGKVGHPEFTAFVGEYFLVGENKKFIDRQALYIDEENIMLDEGIEATRHYAENGALHYAKHIASLTTHKKIFAFGCSGDEKHYRIRPMFVDSRGNYKLLKEVDNFENFSAENIERYYQEQVLGEEPKEVKELKDILNRAKTLHEDLRNYGQLGDQEKPLVVSAILLALNDYETPEKQQAFIDTLIGDTVKTDGQKIFEAVEAHMRRVKVEPQVKLEKVISQFDIIKNRTILSAKNSFLGKTPLRHYAEYLKQYVIDYTKSNSPEDVLGRFYGEFMSYSGGDGQSLGVVLTPRHITELFCDLVQIKPSDRLFDPCSGTGGFLVAGMHHMLEQARGEEQRSSIKKNQIFGIELREDMFSVATTNMILRGDGKSNLICEDFLAQEVQPWRQKNLSVAFMNPPYSQAKSKETSHLSEISFISHLLDCMADEARVVVIVPQSTMVGKTKEDKLIKNEILKKHTLEGVVTLNKDTFYRVGTNACIAIFTAHQPHPREKYVKFVNFEDDGFEVNKHIGLIETERAKEKRQHLLDCWLLDKPAETKFMVKAKIDASDEWLHSFYYFNDEVPTALEIEKTIADYLTFEFNMITHGRGYLFDQNESERL